jgi:precorrin-6B methylase 2
MPSLPDLPFTAQELKHRTQEALRISEGRYLRHVGCVSRWIS